jgi:ABC-type glycerol-3-phosphate transport system substrate-binding protein
VAARRYLIPLQMGTMVMFYAKKIFDDAGVRVPEGRLDLRPVRRDGQEAHEDRGQGHLRLPDANGNWYRDIGWIVGTGKREFDNIIDPTKGAVQPRRTIVGGCTIVAYDMPHTFKAAPSPADTSAARTRSTPASAP